MMVCHSTLKAEAGRSQSFRLAWSTYRVQGQPGLQSKRCSKKGVCEHTCMCVCWIDDSAFKSARYSRGTRFDSQHLTQPVPRET